jgi:hypothetical protein
MCLEVWADLLLLLLLADAISVTPVLTWCIQLVAPADAYGFTAHELDRELHQGGAGDTAAPWC